MLRGQAIGHIKINMYLGWAGQSERFKSVWDGREITGNPLSLRRYTDPQIPTSISNLHDPRVNYNSSVHKHDTWQENFYYKPTKNKKIFPKDLSDHPLPHPR